MTQPNLEEKAVSQKQQKFMGMVDAVQSGKLSPNKVGGSVEKAASTMKHSDVKDFASTKLDKLPVKASENKVLNELSLQDAVEYVSDRKGEVPFMLGGIKWEFVNAKYPDGHTDIGVYRFGHDIVYDYKTWREEMNINETDQSMIQDDPTSMSNKPAAAGTVSAGGVPVGMNDVTENANLFEEINNELNAYSIHHDKLKKMAEDRKPSALILRDRVGAENETNFKKDLQHSGTKDIINVEKELMWKDQQTEVGKDPQKLGQDIEKTGLKANKGEAFKNVGNSTNEDGDEVTKRNLTTEEQDEVNLYRKGMHSLVYDNKPDQKFEDRQKADMGDAVYEIREKQLEDFGKAPMYNKDNQPVMQATAKKVQFDKEQSGWNERTGLKESMISGRYANALNKKHIIDFNLNEAKFVDTSAIGDLFELDFTGLGNAYNSKTVDNKVSVNESVVNVLAEHRFFTDGKSVYVIKNSAQKLNENEIKQAPIINEEVNKMKHLLGYKPATYTSTKNIKL